MGGRTVSSLLHAGVVIADGHPPDRFSLENPQPPGHRLHTMHERWVAEEERINRKLDPLARKIRHLVDLQRDYVAEREEAELRGATFKPAIGEVRVDLLEDGLCRLW